MLTAHRIVPSVRICHSVSRVSIFVLSRKMYFENYITQQNLSNVWILRQGLPSTEASYSVTATRMKPCYSSNCNKSLSTLSKVLYTLIKSTIRQLFVALLLTLSYKMPLNANRTEQLCVRTSFGIWVWITRKTINYLSILHYRCYMLGIDRVNDVANCFFQVREVCSHWKIMHKWLHFFVRIPDEGWFNLRDEYKIGIQAVWAYFIDTMSLEKYTIIVRQNTSPWSPQNYNKATWQI